MKQFVISRIDWFGDEKYLKTGPKETETLWTVDPGKAFKIADMSTATEIAKSLRRVVTISSINVEIEPIIRVRS